MADESGRTTPQPSKGRVEPRRTISPAELDSLVRRLGEQSPLKTFTEMSRELKASVSPIQAAGAVSTPTSPSTGLGGKAPERASPEGVTTRSAQRKARGASSSTGRSPRNISESSTRRSPRKISDTNSEQAALEKDEEGPSGGGGGQEVPVPCEGEEVAEGPAAPKLNEDGTVTISLDDLRALLNGQQADARVSASTGGQGSMAAAEEVARSLPPRNPQGLAGVKALLPKGGRKIKSKKSSSPKREVNIPTQPQEEKPELVRQQEEQYAEMWRAVHNIDEAHAAKAQAEEAGASPVQQLLQAGRAALGSGGRKPVPDEAPAKAGTEGAGVAPVEQPQQAGQAESTVHHPMRGWMDKLEMRTEGNGCRAEEKFEGYWERLAAESRAAQPLAAGMPPPGDEEDEATLWQQQQFYQRQAALMEARREEVRSRNRAGVRVWGGEQKGGPTPRWQPPPRAARGQQQQQPRPEQLGERSRARAASGGAGGLQRSSVQAYLTGSRGGDGGGGGGGWGDSHGRVAPQAVPLGRYGGEEGSGGGDPVGQFDAPQHSPRCAPLPPDSRFGGQPSTRAAAPWPDPVRQP
jgi:hypothetical protein